MLKFFPQSQAFRFNALMEHLRTPLFRNGYALIISTGITSLLGLLYWAVAARTYSTEVVGLNFAAVSAMTFLSGLAQINLQETMVRFIPQAGKQTLFLVLTTYATVIVLSIAVGVIFCVGLQTWTPALSFLTESPALALWFILALVLCSLFVIQDSVMMGMRQAIWIPLENAVFSVLKIVLLILLVVGFPRDGIFLSWTIAFAVVIVPINYLIFRRLIPQHSRQTPTQTQVLSVRQIARYVAANYLVAIFANMSTALMPILITQIVGATASAHFSIAWVLASALQIAVANMSTSLTVEGAANQGNLDEYRRRALIGIGRIVVPLAAVLIFGAPLILQVMGAEYSENATVLMQLLALAALPNIFNMVYVGLARVQNRIYSVIFVYGANAVMVIGLSILFMPQYGITGVGLAWVISQTAIALVLNGIPQLKRKLMTLEKEI